MNRISVLLGSQPVMPALQVVECATYQVGNQVADHSTQNSDKQLAQKVFHVGSALRFGHAQILLSRLEQHPLGLFPDHCSSAKNHIFSVVSHSEIPSRQAKRQAMNAPTYCKATGRRIGVCACPICVPVPPKEPQP